MSARKRKGMGSRPPNAPLIWARDGEYENAAEHPAYLLPFPPGDHTSSHVEEECVWIKWASNGTTAFIPKSRISSELSSRRRRGRDGSDSMPENTASAGSANAREEGSEIDTEQNIKPTVKKKKKKLSLSMKQRLQWREHNDQQQQNSNSKLQRKSPPEQLLHEHHLSNHVGRSLELDNIKQSSLRHSQKANDKAKNSSKIGLQQSTSDTSPEATVETLASTVVDAMSEEKTDGNQFHVDTAKNTAVEVIEIGDDDNEEEKKDDIDSTRRHEPLKAQHFFPPDELDAFAETKRAPSLQTKQHQTQSRSETSPSTLPDHSYSNKSSAYIQHIAEACTLIMTDARWRTCDNKRPCQCNVKSYDGGEKCIGKALLSWEDGDDLSAVKAFMSLYDEGGGGGKDNGDGRNDEEEPDQVATNDHSSLLKSDETTKSTETVNGGSGSLADEVFERSMHLYSRMFHRKGPWFDLTDLYIRYYAPKTKRQSAIEDQVGVAVDRSDVETFTSCNEPVASDSTNAVMADTREKAMNFFTPKSTRKDSKQSNTKKRYAEQLRRHREALKCFFTDVIRLLSMGLVRTFQSEYECGSVAGNVTSRYSGGVQRGTLLLSDERREVLRRLGGGKSPKAMAPRSDRSEQTTNEILLQMQSQQTVFSAYAFSDGNPKQQMLLPVRKHVDLVLLNKLGAKIASLSEEGTMFKSGKSDMGEVSRMINSAWSDVHQAVNPSSDGSNNGIVTTLRLREAPLMTLRRCLRIFLCAGGGPGSMRGNGRNGWLSVNTASTDLWHTVDYPGLLSRLGLTSFEFKHCYQQLHEDEERECASLVRVFRRFCDFQLWEKGAELRSFVDEMAEAHELERTTWRRQQRALEASSSKTGDELEEMNVFKEPSVRDRFALLTEDGRNAFIQAVIAQCLHDATSSLGRIDTDSVAIKVFRLVESDIIYLQNAVAEDDEDDGFTSDAERLICAVAIICHRILQCRLDHKSQSLSSLLHRPWLRHFSFDAILVYAIWDCIPVFERKGLNSMAVMLLTTILFGSTNHGQYGEEKDGMSRLLEISESVAHPSVQCLLPRRNRGKAFERLVIDISHVDRLLKKKNNAAKPKPKAKNDGKEVNEREIQPIQRLVYSILRSTSKAGSISFCSLRNLARRLKVPLVNTMKNVQNDEMTLLNIRLENENESNQNQNSYSDWTPKTDFAVANALSTGEEAMPCQRCTFVGYDDAEEEKSLNVEQLAMEYYFHGRLPKQDKTDTSLSTEKGYYVGWHCEGGHVRALYRILCMQDLLRYCSCETLFLTPFQASPHDLHVGYSKSFDADTNSYTPIRGFYERRRDVIESFFSRLSDLDSQGVSDLVHDAVKHRVQQHESDWHVMKDVLLQKDISELRTLSMIAAGIGGSALATIFRCLCFDYRLYSGGLPDLLLVRARFVQQLNGNETDSIIVDLGDWIGESFSKENAEEKNVLKRINMLIDRDDEFLGCSKNADGSKLSQRGKTDRGQGLTSEPSVTLPAKLEMKHEDKDVTVDCMFVEVKSSNDRLDSRQEDWLNILDGCTNARVCKFEATKKHNNAKTKKK